MKNAYNKLKYAMNLTSSSLKGDVTTDPVAFYSQRSEENLLRRVFVYALLRHRGSALKIDRSHVFFAAEGRVCVWRCG